MNTFDSKNIHNYFDNIIHILTENDEDYFGGWCVLSSPLMDNLLDYVSKHISTTSKNNSETLFNNWLETKCGWGTDPYLNDCFADYKEIEEHVSDFSTRIWTIEFLDTLLTPLERLLGIS